MRTEEEKERLIEQKKYEIEARYIHKQWELESEKSDYFEEKFGKYRDIGLCFDYDRMEQEYVEMYDLHDLLEEEGEVE